MGFE
jgi:hypothetical protein